MSNFGEFIRKTMREKNKEGIKIGKSLVAKEMINCKMPDEDIIKYTHLSKKRLKELKL